MATRVVPGDGDVSSSRDPEAAVVERALWMFQIGAGLSARVVLGFVLALAMLFGGLAGEPSNARQGDEHASPSPASPLVARELAAETESKDEREERADAPPSGVLQDGAGSRHTVALHDRAPLRLRVGTREGLVLGLGRGPPARV